MPTLPFLHLRVRTPYSLAEGALGISKLVGLCQQYHLPAVGVIDSNNLFGALEFATTAAKAGIQPIIGCNLHLISPLQTTRTGETGIDTLAVYAATMEGYQNLLHLVSHSYLHPASSDDTPCISYDALSGKTAGLLACTGTLDTSLGKMLLRDSSDAESHLAYLKGLFPESLYVGVARHGLITEQQIETALVNFAHQYELPLLAACDVFFAEPEFVEAHEALMCIAAGVTISHPERRRSRAEYAFLSPQKIAERYADLPEALINTVHFARRCSVMPEVRAPILPRFSEEEREEQVLERMAQAGLRKRLVHLEGDKAVYEQRLAYELATINNMGFAGYFLIVADFIQWAKGQGIPVGPGRGSGAGSVVAWALTITDLDPIRWGLLFERFLNPERVSMPDFDIDFCQDRRDEVIAYVQQKYGAQRVAQIITFGKLQARAVLRDVGRVLEMPYGQVDGICKLVPNNPVNPTTLEEAVSGDAQLRELRRQEETGKLISIGLQLEGLYRHASTHAAGIVIGDRPLSELVPLYRDPRSELPATQFNMKYAESAGLVKFDFLGLKTLTVMQKACALIKGRTGTAPDLETLPLDDAKTYALLSSGETSAVFQLESAGMRDVLRKMRPDRFEDIIALVALYRPGPMDNIPRYVACKHGEEQPDYLHPMLTNILKETFGVIIYQEQVMQIAQEMGGYSLGAADLLRRAMGKKIKEEMDAQAAIFLDGAKKQGVDASTARNIFEQVAKFAGYGFNKSHAAAYALVAYQTAWLKANYPVEFMAATMTYDMHNTDKLAVFKQELQRLQIPLLPPNINHSSTDFSVEDGAVRYALAAIKGVGETAVLPILENRLHEGAFTSVFQLAARVGKTLNKRLLESLIGAGALDSLYPCRASLWAGVEQILTFAGTRGEENTSQGNLLGLVETSLTRQDPALPKTIPWSALERLAHEHTALGFYLSAHPLDSYQGILEQQKVTPSTALTELSAARVTLAGVMVAKKERRSAKGNKYAFVQFSDPWGVFEVTFFSETLQEARALLEAGTPLLIHAECGEAGEGGGGMRLTAQTVRALDGIAASSGMGLELTITTVETLAVITKILENTAAGECPVRLCLVLNTAGYPKQVYLDLQRRYRLSESVRQQLKGLSGIIASRDVEMAAFLKAG